MNTSFFKNSISVKIRNMLLIVTVVQWSAFWKIYIKSSIASISTCIFSHYQFFFLYTFLLAASRKFLLFYWSINLWNLYTCHYAFQTLPLRINCLLIHIILWFRNCLIILKCVQIYPWHKTRYCEGRTATSDKFLLVFLTIFYTIIIGLEN